MDDIFTKRMDIVMKHNSLGARVNENSNHIMNKTFSNDPNFRRGNLYDWNMNLLEEVDFKFEKVKTFTAEGYEVEYMIQFRPHYHPEYSFKDSYYKDDGRERLGFYIDVYDYEKEIYETWMILGKDDRVTFDRYNAFKCNWCFEWITDDKYYNCIGVLRDSIKGSENTNTDGELGGTSISGSKYIILPSNEDVANIKYGTRFIISDNINNPQVFEVININDSSPLGITRLFLKQALFNPHTDICGDINNMIENEYCFELPLEDLPIEYGRNYHAICNCIKSKGLPQEDVPLVTDWRLECNEKLLYINGQPVSVEAITSHPDKLCQWHIFVDGVEYSVSDLNGYFDIIIEGNVLVVKATNVKMNKYILKIAIYDDDRTYYDSVEMEVKI